MKPVTESQLRFAHQTRALRRLTLQADGGAFELHVHTAGGEELTLVKMRKADGASIPRRFNSPLAALTLLFKFGIHDVNVNLERWRPGDKSTARTRVDSATRMKEAHKALSEKSGQRIDADARTEVAAPKSDVAISTSEEPFPVGKVDLTIGARKPLLATHESGVTRHGHGHGIKVEVRKKRGARQEDPPPNSALAPAPEEDGQAPGVSGEPTS